MKPIKQLYQTVLSMLLLLLSVFHTAALYADDVDTLSSKLDVIRNQERHIYYPGNGMVLNYMLPGLLQEVLAKTDVYLVLHSPLGEPLVIPLSKETDRLQPFYQTNDVSELPAGDYYFSVILTVPGGDPLKVDDWYLGPYGRISYERLRISAAATDPDDKNRDGLFDGDVIDVNGFSDPTIAAQLKEDLIRLKRQVFYPDTPLDLSYVLPGRLSQVFAGRANAHLVIQVPGFSDLLYLPLAALQPDGEVNLLQQVDSATLPAGDYLLGVVFTRPGGNPADVRDWYPDVDPVNARKRIAVNHQGFDDRDWDTNGTFDDDNNGDGASDMAQMELYISAMCPNETDYSCRYDKLPLFIGRSAEMGDLMDVLCKDNQVCADSVQEAIIQDAFNASSSAASLLCAAGDNVCQAQVAYPIYQAKHNVQQRNAVFQRICSGIGNPEICRNSGSADNWAVLYESMRNINAILRIPLFKRICPDGQGCGANGGFGDLVQNEIEYWQIIDDLCPNDGDGSCTNALFGAIDQVWEASFAQSNPTSLNGEAFMAAYEQELSALFCTGERDATCPELVSAMVRYDWASEAGYWDIVDGLCPNGVDGTCINALWVADEQAWLSASEQYPDEVGGEPAINPLDEAAFDAFYEQQLSALFCTDRAAACPGLIGKMVRNDGQYQQLLESMCGQNYTCMEIVGNVAWYMAIFDDVKKAATAFCQSDTACLTDKVPQILRLASLPLDDLSIGETATALCQDDTACDERFYSLLFAEYNLTSALDGGLLN